MPRILLLGLIVALCGNGASADCVDAFSCEACFAVDPGIHTGCVWCENPSFPVCVPNNFAAFCAANAGTTVSNVSACPVFGPRCTDYGDTCQGCLDAPGMSCSYCSGGLLHFRTCAGGSDTEAGCTTVGGSFTADVCPLETCDTSAFPIGDVHVNVSGNNSGTCCCGTADAPCATVACGITRAAQANRPILVLVGDGVYHEFNNHVPEMPAGVTVRAVTPHQAIIDAGGQGRIFDFRGRWGVDSFVTLDGIVLRNGRSESGGCVRVDSRSPTFIDVVFENCTALLSTNDVKATLVDGHFGGAVYLHISFSWFHGCLFRNNINEGDHRMQGVAIFGSEAALNVSSCVFEDNHGVYDGVEGSGAEGGAVLLVEPTTDKANGRVVPTVFTNCIFRRNTLTSSTGCSGGALKVGHAAEVEVHGCLFEDHELRCNSGTGGAVAVQGATFYSSSSMYRNNSIDALFNSAGGAVSMIMAVCGGPEGAVHSNDTFEDNRVELSYDRIAQTGVGGAVSLLSVSSTSHIPAFAFCTFRGNRVHGVRSAEGGGLHVENTQVSVRDSLFENNEISAECPTLQGGGIQFKEHTSSDYSLVLRTTFLDNRINGSLYDARFCPETVSAYGNSLCATIGSSPDIVDCVVRNGLSYGASEMYGAVFLGGGSPSRRGLIRRTLFQNNTVEATISALGGALSTGPSYSYDVYNCTFLDNTVVSVSLEFFLTSVSSGGALAHASEGLLQLHDCYFARNCARGSSVSGGAISAGTIRGNAFAYIALDNCIIEDNYVEAIGPSFCGGGGVGLKTVFGSIINSIIRNNYMIGSKCGGAGFGALVMDDDFFLLRNVYFMGNSATMDGGAMSIGASLIRLEQVRVCNNSLPEVVCTAPCQITGNSGFKLDLTREGVGEPPVCPVPPGGTCTDFCSGRGSCDVEVCSCDPGFWGEQCEHECNGGGSPMCSGHGVCSDGINGTGACQCERGFYGLGCARACPQNCSAAVGGGTCADGETGDGVCTCNPTFYGKSCNQTCAGTVVLRDVRLPCLGNGVCDYGSNGTGVCTCSGNFIGESCYECRAGYAGTACHVPCGGGELTCSGHGVCNSGREGSGGCVCDDGYFGRGCESRAVSVCGPFCLNCTATAAPPLCTACAARYILDGGECRPSLAKIGVACGDGFVCDVGGVCSQGRNGTECTPCEVGSVAEYVGLTACRKCEKGLKSLENACVACRDGSQCEEGQEEVDPGYWGDASMEAFVECRGRDKVACPGGSLQEDGSAPCGAGHKGPFCATCVREDETYGKARTRCQKCAPPAANAVLFMLYFFAIVTFVTYTYIVSAKAKASDAVNKVLVNYMQVLSILATFVVNTDTLYGDALGWMSFASGISVDILPMQCLVPLNHYAMLLAGLGAQVAAYGTICALAVVAGFVQGSAFGDVFVPACLVWTYTNYPTIVSLTLKVFRCRSEAQRLAADLTIECPTTQYYAFIVLGVVLTIVWIFGLPILFSWKAKVSSESTGTQWKFLRNGYRPTAVFFEGWLMGRKALLVLISVVVSAPLMQVSLAAVLLACALGVQSRVRPFAVKRVNDLEFVGLVISLCTILVSVTVYESALTSNGSAVASFCYVVSFAAMFGYLVLLVAVVFKTKGPVAITRFLPLWLDLSLDEVSKDDDVAVEIYAI